LADLAEVTSDAGAIVTLQELLRRLPG